jgi:hypothetical protein
MGIKIPQHPPISPRKRRLTYDQVGARWRVPSLIARHALEEACVPSVEVEQKPRRGVRLSDLLRFEAAVRSGKIRPINLARAPAALEVVR